jgi:hypothetical protein
MSANLDDLAAELAPAARELVAAAGAAGLLPQVTSTVRSRAEQTRLFRRSQQGLQRYPVAPPGSSAHEYGWAFDLVVSPFDAIYDVAATWIEWGGAWNRGDAVHFELPGASAEAKRLGSELTIADQPTNLIEDLLNFGYGFIPVLGQVQMAADLSTLFPSLSHNETLLILANPTKYWDYIQALRNAYR